MSSHQRSDASSMHVEHGLTHAAAANQHNGQPAPAGQPAGTLTAHALREVERQSNQPVSLVTEQHAQEAAQLNCAFESMGHDIPEWMMRKMAQDAVSYTYAGNQYGGKRSDQK